MEENRFRVWDEINKQMYYPEEAKYCLTMIGNVCLDLDVEGEKLMNVNYRTKAMLSTGLKDKNGKEIYEEDIIEWRDSLAKIEWGDVGFWANYQKDEFPDNVMWLKFYSCDWEDCEVIGNIYENPSLLEEK